MKPQEILNLEKHLGFKLTEGEGHKTYSLNAQGKVASLNLGSCKITDIAGLKGLTNLTELYLNDNQIADIAVLKNLTNLTELILNNNQITDIAGLKGLTNLTELILNNNQITDIDALKDLTNLTWLFLHNNQITDIAGLKDLTNLTSLDLCNNQIADIAALKNLTNLVFLRLNNNQIADIAGLKNLTNLTRLYLNNNQITDIDALNNLTKLYWLELKKNQITNIAALKNLTNLTWLYLNDNQITDIAVLKGLINLTWLFLYNNQIADIAALKNLTNLTWLYLNNNQIADIAALKDLKNLTGLYLNNNQIADITVLKSLTKLEGLGLENNQIADITALQGLTKLIYLGLGNNQIADISVLRDLANLASLDLDTNQLSDCSFLEYLPNLKDFYLNGKKISDISALPEILKNKNSYAPNTQKIVVKNFGPVENAEIEVKKVLVLIGEQAGGKSTLVKLIYFFKSLGDDYFDIFYKTEGNTLSIQNKVNLSIIQKFHNFFGSTAHLPPFTIQYYFDMRLDRFLQLELDSNKQLTAWFSHNFFSATFKNDIDNAKNALVNIEKNINDRQLNTRERLALEQDKLVKIQQISALIDDLYNNEHTSSSFVIAGRNATVSYEDIFDFYYFEKAMTDQLDGKRKKIEKVNSQSFDEMLMIKFLQDIHRMRSVFRRHGGSFTAVTKSLSTIFPKNILDNISKILKAEYKIDDSVETLTFADGQYVELKNASSGQKEVIRILQDLVLSILENQSTFRIIEEPEAHLFPVAQKQLVETLIAMKNHNAKNQLIITTHSPYILTVLNNLLFATRVINKNANHLEAVTKHIPQIFHINPNDFAAYSLGNSLMEGSEYCENIFNPKSGTIKQNYLDTVSHILGNDFDYLYSLHAQSFKA